jgi:phosphoribosylaminoimidazole (AIR) synthetase
MLHREHFLPHRRSYSARSKIVEITREGFIGVQSNGVHSNGLSLARNAFFENNKYGINHKFDELGTTLGEELLRPTDIYVPEALEILERVRRKGSYKHNKRWPSQFSARRSKSRF